MDKIKEDETGYGRSAPDRRPDESYERIEIMAEKTGRTGVSDLKKYFGLKEGQTLRDFATETKQLTDTDFVQLRDGIRDNTLTY